MVYSPAITITHYTPARRRILPLLSPLFSALFATSLLLRFSRPRTDSPYSPSHLLFSLLFSPYPSPFVLRLFCRVGHGYSAIVFDLSCSCCGCSGEFRVPSVTAYFIGISSLFFSFSLSFFSFFIPFFYCPVYCTPVYFSAHLVASFFLLSFELSSVLWLCSHFLLFLKWILEFMK